MRLKELRKKGLDKDIKYFLHFERLSFFTVMRWIEYTGWIIAEPSDDIIIITTPMGGQIRLRNALQFEKRKECMFMKDKLNSEIVKENEPENWIHTWRKTYEKTHKQT